MKKIEKMAYVQIVRGVAQLGSVETYELSIDEAHKMADETASDVLIYKLVTVVEPSAHAPEQRRASDGGKQPLPKNGAGDRALGDWKCPKCGYINLPNNADCSECGKARPPFPVPYGG